MHGTRNASHARIKTEQTRRRFDAVENHNSNQPYSDQSRKSLAGNRIPQTHQCSAAFICCTLARHKQRSVRLSTLANSKGKAHAPHAPSFASHCSRQNLLQTACGRPMLQSLMAENTNAAAAASTLCCNAVTMPMRCSAPSQLASQQKEADARIAFRAYSFYMTLN